MKVLILLLSPLLSSCVPAFLAASTVTTTTALQDKSMGSIIDDNVIAARIKKDFLAGGFRDLYLRINVSVSQGRVMYAGEVKKEDDILSAIDIAWKQNGVKEVINELRIANHEGLDVTQFAKDSWITTQVKARAIFNKEVKLINYTVVTIRNVVYLLGIARSEKEMHTIAAVASEVPGVEKVITYAKIAESR